MMHRVEARMALVDIAATFEDNILQGIGLTRDSLVSVMYPEGLNSTKSSGTLQRTDRHEILDQKRSDFQESV